MGTLKKGFLLTTIITIQTIILFLINLKFGSSFKNQVLGGFIIADIVLVFTFWIHFIGGDD